MQEVHKVKKVEICEPDVVSDIELRVCDELAASAESTEEHSEQLQSGLDCAPVHSNLKCSESSPQAKNHTFSDSFGSPTQQFSGHRSGGNLKQFFNCIYFAAGAVAIHAVCVSWNLPILWLPVPFFGAFAIVAFFAAWNGRVHPADFAVNLSRGTRSTLRVAALMIPIPFFAILLAQSLAYGQLKEGQQLFRDDKYKDALTHLNLAATLNPRLEEAFMELADCYNFIYEYQNSLANAEKAIQLDPTDGAAWASKAWALNLQLKFTEALPAALNAVKYAPESGQANHALAEAYLHLGNYELALQPASKHVQIHDTESAALELRADILEKLGRLEEAAQDRAAAKTLNN